MRFLPVCLALLALGAAPAWAGPAADPTPAPPEAMSAGLPGVAWTAGLVEPLAASIGDFGSQSLCNAQAQCGGYSVSCSGNTSCTAHDRNCSIGQQGYVDCDGNRTYCAGSCCPCGTCGATRWIQTSNCCSSNLFLWKYQQCSSSGWFDTGITDCLVACDGSGLP